MSDRVEYLDQVKDAIKEVGDLAPQIEKHFRRADKQAEIRTGVIQTINTMCDALQLACDLVSAEISSSITEFNKVKGTGDVEDLRYYFERIAGRFADRSLGRLLHEGKVCGELHALADGFRQPFSKETRAGESFWRAVYAFFKRSTRMSEALERLWKGEKYCLRSLGQFLNDMRDRAEKANAQFDAPWLRQEGEKMVDVMRKKRKVLQVQAHQVRDVADACILKLE